MAQDRLGTAACTLLSAQPLPSALAQLVSKPPNSKWSGLTPRSGLRSASDHTNHRHGAPGPSGAQAARTIQACDANGSFGVVSVDTTESDNIHAIQGKTKLLTLLDPTQ